MYRLVTTAILSPEMRVAVAFPSGVMTETVPRSLRGMEEIAIYFASKYVIESGSTMF